jgi:DNA-binding transcriptional LysR family regulator
MSRDLSDLAAFASVAKAGGFRQAARAGGAESASSLSEAIRRLEARAGVRLLNRTTRSVAPTAAGATLLDRLTPALAAIDEAVTQMRSAQIEPSGPLRINAPEPAIRWVLAPMVPAFMTAYPRVRLEIIAESGLVDIVARGFDAGVRWEESLALDMVAVPLGPPQRYVVVATPELVERLGAPAHPRDLLTKPCLRAQYDSGARPPWEFERGGEALKVAVEGPVLTNSRSVLMSATLAGLGFLQTFDAAASSYLASGDLITVLDDWSEPFPGPKLYYPSRRHQPSALRAFVEFLQAKRRREGW